MADVTLRTAEEPDLPDLRRWSTSLYADHPGPLPVDGTKITNTFVQLRAQPFLGELLVIEQASVPVGFAFVASYWSNEYGGRTWLLDELVIEASRRGHGLGGAFLDALERRARASGVACVWLEVDADNPRARVLYERHGYVDTTRSCLRRLVVERENVAE